MYGYTSNHQQPRTTKDGFDTWHELRMAFKARRRELYASVDLTIKGIVDEATPLYAHYAVTNQLKFWCDTIIESHRSEKHLQQFILDK